MTRYHRFQYLGKGETILLEPAPQIYYWLVMYLPPAFRRKQLPSRLFRFIVSKLLGHHHIHCSIQIQSFKKLSVDFAWQYKGHSKFFTGCSAFTYQAVRADAPRPDGLEIDHQILRRRPYLRTIINQCHAADIIQAIKTDIEQN